MTPRNRSPRATPSLAGADDERLVAMVRSGHEGAFSELHTRYRPALERLARRLLHDSSHDPEDVVQDAFLSAYTALRAVDRPIALKAWLSTIVRNRAVDYLRQPHTSYVGPDFERMITLAPVLVNDPGELVSMREEVREAVDAIGRLPDRQRIALVRREFEGRRVEEVAAELGTTLPATWSLLFRARSTVAASRSVVSPGCPSVRGDRGARGSKRTGRRPPDTCTPSPISAAHPRARMDLGVEREQPSAAYSGYPARSIALADRARR